jgi:hypothetical protein
MQVQVNTDDNLRGGASLATWVEKEVNDTLSRFGSYLTRVEVHLGDENASKAGDQDKRCAVEARIAGQDPVSVTNKGPNVEEACRGALRKLRGLLESRIGRQQDHKGATSIRDRSDLT